MAVQAVAHRSIQTKAAHPCSRVVRHNQPVITVPGTQLLVWLYSSAIRGVTGKRCGVLNPHGMSLPVGEVCS
jgi:hypothetical protein